MRLLFAATVAALAISAAAAEPPTMGSGPMRSSGMSMGGQTMTIHHQVADYAKWRVAYDADQANRKAAGLTNCRVQRSMDDANDILISCDMADVTKARSFTSSKALADTMSKAGVMGKPQFMYLTAPK